MAFGLKETLTWRDAKGNVARTSFYVAGTGTPASQQTAANAVRVAMTALTNAALAAETGPETSFPAPVAYGAAATYEDIEDKANFTVQDLAGGLHHFQVPAPKAAIFLADGETIDNGNTAVAAFETALIANTVTRSGGGFSFVPGGIRIRRKLHRRANIFTLNPALTGPEE